MKFIPLEERIVFDASIVASLVAGATATHSHAATPVPTDAAPSSTIFFDPSYAAVPQAAHAIQAELNENTAVGETLNPYPVNPSTGKAQISDMAWSTSPGAPFVASVYVNTTGMEPGMVSSIYAAFNSLNVTWQARGLGIAIGPTTNAAQANIAVHFSQTSEMGGYAQGLVGDAEYDVSLAPAGVFYNGNVLYHITGQVEVNIIQGWNWYVGLQGTIPNNALDFQSVVTHELGHAIGLAHDTASYPGLNSDNRDVMYPSIGYGVNQRQLSPTDVGDLQFLYAFGIEPATVVTASNTPTITSSETFSSSHSEIFAPSDNSDMQSTVALYNVNIVENHTTGSFLVAEAQYDGNALPSSLPSIETSQQLSSLPSAFAAEPSLGNLNYDFVANSNHGIDLASAQLVNETSFDNSDVSSAIPLIIHSNQLQIAEDNNSAIAEEQNALLLIPPSSEQIVEQQHLLSTAGADNSTADLHSLLFDVWNKLAEMATNCSLFVRNIFQIGLVQ